MTDVILLLHIDLVNIYLHLSLTDEYLEILRRYRLLVICVYPDSCCNVYYISQLILISFLVVAPSAMLLVPIKLVVGVVISSAVPILLFSHA